MRKRLFAVICVLLALAMLPGGASAKAKKAPKKDIGIQLYSVRSLIGVFVFVQIQRKTLKKSRRR